MGRGLDSLVSAPEKPIRPSQSSLPVSEIRPNPFQPRRAIDPESIDRLVSSVKQSGILQPIVVRRAGEGYEIIAGERRWTAAKAAGLESVPVLIRDASEEQMIELALIENIQREDLNPIDRALAYKQFCDDFELTAQEVAVRVGEDRTTVTNYIRLLELAPDIRTLVASGKISMGHARAILGLEEENARTKLARRAVQEGLSVRAVEELVKAAKRSSGELTTGRKKSPDRSPNVQDLEARFESALKTRVTIKEGRKKGKGKITIDYYSLDDFDRIAEMLGVDLT